MLSTLLALALVPQSVHIDGPLYPRQPGVVSVVRDGVSVATDLPTIQAGLDLALDGDVLRLSGGRFAGPGNVDLVLSAALTFVGEGAQKTLVDGEGSSFFLQTDRDLEIEGMMVRRCIAGDGAAVHSTAGHVTLVEVVFEDNEAGLRGGAVRVMESLDVTGCVFRRNRVALAGLGGALTAYTVDARDCLFEENVSLGRGGAMDVFEGNVTDCVFLRNEAADFGGALTALFFVVLEIDRCTFLENTAGDTAGALYFSVAFGAVTVSNSLIARNVSGNGPALLGSRSTDVIGCTVVDNVRQTPGGAGGGGIVASINTIYWNNRSTAGSIFEQQFDVTPGNTQFAYCNVEGSGVSLPTVLDDDPLFVDAASGNYRVQSSSPCVDAGFTASINLAQLDLDGTPRVKGPSADVGSYERQP